MSTVFLQIDFTAKIQFIRYKIEICNNYSNFLHFKDSRKNNFPGNVVLEKIREQSM